MLFAALLPVVAEVKVVVVAGVTGILPLALGLEVRKGNACILQKLDRATEMIHRLTGGVVDLQVVVWNG